MLSLSFGHDWRRIYSSIFTGPTVMRVTHSQVSLLLTIYMVTDTFVSFFWFCLNRIKHVLIDFGLRKDNEECGTSKIMKPRITPTRGTKIHFKRYKSNFNGNSIPKVLTFILCAKLKFMVVLSLF